MISHGKAASPASDNQDWPAYGGGPQEIRHSNLDQINKTNVARLQVAWTYDTEDGAGASETQPIVVNGILFGLTPRHKVIALDGNETRRGRKIAIPDIVLDRLKMPDTLACVGIQC